MLNPFLDRFIYTNGLKYSKNQFLLLNTPLALIPTDVLCAIASIPDPVQNRVLYYAVKKQVLEQLMPTFTLSTSSELNVKFLAEFFSACGIGLVEIVHFDPAHLRAILVLEQNPIAERLAGKAHAPVDHVLRGIFAGVFSSIFKTDIDCVEHQCMALNHKNC